MQTFSRPPQLQGKIFKGTTAIRRGWLTKSGLRSGAWRKLFRNVYADSSLTMTHELRCIAVSSYLLPDGAVLAGRSAAHLHGISPFDLASPVEVLTPTPFSPTQGVTIHIGAVEPSDIVVVRGVAVTSPLRTCADLAYWLDEMEAVVFLDMFAGRHLVTAEQLRLYANLRAGQRGSLKLRQAADLVDGASQSPQETRLRVTLRRANLPKFVAQYVIRHEGKFVARADLALPELLMAVEYDGGWHASKEQLEADRKRLNRLVSAGWKVIHVTAGSMRDDFALVVSEIRAAIRMQKRAIARGKITATFAKKHRS